MNRKKRLSPSVKEWRSKLITIAAFISLTVAWWIGYSQIEGLDTVLTHHYNSASTTIVEGRDHVYLLDSGSSNKKIYAATDNGYGGPLAMTFSLDKFQQSTER